MNRIILLSDLAREMSHLEKNRIPLILLLSRSDCHFCHEVRNNYLLPLVRTISEQKLLIREFVSDRSPTLIGADGAQISVAGLLKILQVNFFPTVVFLGSGMRVLADALVGLDRAGFYSAYLDQRIASAIKEAQRIK